MNDVIFQMHPELDNLKRSYYQWLMNTGQEEAAGEVILLLTPVKLYKKIIDDTLFSSIQSIPFPLFSRYV